MRMNYWTTIFSSKFSLVTQKINQNYKFVLFSVVDYIQIVMLVNDNCSIVEKLISVFLCLYSRV